MYRKGYKDRISPNKFTIVDKNVKKCQKMSTI